VLDTVAALQLIAERGEGDGYGIASEADTFSPLQLAEMYGLEVDLQPPRKTSRPSSNIQIDKTVALGWEPTESLRDYIATKKQNK
jgi:nucleoside-diphosphate-sugar epimerase